MGQYFEGDESNATIPITTKGLTVKGILDGGAGVSIVTKNCWETMGRPHLVTTTIVVKMANGSIVKPIGMLEDLKIKVFGHKIRITFNCYGFLQAHYGI
ncbi:retropepsin-like aspartic protease [Enterobacter cloacae complex sp. GF14B]|uniref:retropepsin-like aspartic protease n=1 Tax=Enterobacter cloacae complex sp. GF14B TaxID=2511982 RepID=UPI0034D6D60D